mmetsp:Transcript_33184/g.87200  ORF Transcript_33184/g.87200 Transcript_33184/m.87200 type:complete len:233 (-) Transcript_33184:878-1576(-)
MPHMPAACSHACACVSSMKWISTEARARPCNPLSSSLTTSDGAEMSFGSFTHGVRDPPPLNVAATEPRKRSAVATSLVICECNAAAAATVMARSPVSMRTSRRTRPLRVGASGYSSYATDTASDAMFTHAATACLTAGTMIGSSRCSRPDASTPTWSVCQSRASSVAVLCVASGVDSSGVTGVRHSSGIRNRTRARTALACCSCHGARVTSISKCSTSTYLFGSFVGIRTSP